MGRPSLYRYGTVVLALALLPFFFSTPTSASNPAKDPYASYRPMERFQPDGEFTVSVLRGKEWKEAGRLEFDRFYRERRADLSRFVPAGEAATVRIVQKGGGAAHVDAATLGGAVPSSIRGSEDTLAKKKLSKADFDVVDAFGKTLELSFPSNSKDRTLSLVARVEGEQRVGIPFLFPPANHGRPVDSVSTFYSYLPGSGSSASLKNGRLDDRAKPFFREWSLSASGHPSSYTYGWVGSDEKNLYVRIDFTGDDTRDGGADYTSVLVKGKDGVREFKLSEADTRWGKPSYTYTGKVTWQHKVYDFAIPWKETATVPGKPVELAFSAYGTLSGFQQGVYETAAAYDSVNNRYLVVYTRYTGPYPETEFDIYGQLVDADGTFLGSEFGIRTNSWNNRYPAVAFDPVNRQYLVVFEDDGDGYGIFGSLLDEDGALVNTVSVAYSPASAAKRFPSVAFNGRNQTYLVAWQDSRNGIGLIYDIFGQIVNADGSKDSGNFPISTALDTQEYASVAANDADGTFLVVFDDFRSFDTLDIYGQLVLDDGSLVGTLDNVNLVVSNNGFNQRLPKVSFDPVTKRFLAVWQDYRNGGLPDVYGQFLDNTGAAAIPADTSVNLAVSTQADDQDSLLLLHSGPAGAYLAAWHDDRSGGFSDYGQVLLGDGTLFGSTAASNVPLVPNTDNVVRTYPMGSAANSSVAQALVSFAADPSQFDLTVGDRLGVRILGAPPLPGGDLMVVTTIPDNNATNVSVNSAITAIFNMAIDRSTVDDTSFVVERTSDGSPVAGTFSFSADNTVVIFTPSAALDNNTSYTVTLPSDYIYDQTGTKYLLDDYAWSFTTASASSSVILFFQDTPSIFGCSVAPGKATWQESAAALCLFILPALVLFTRKRRGTGERGHRTLFRGFFLFLLAAAMILAASAPSHAGALGPPQPSVKAGQFGGAIGYFYTEDKWEPDTSSAQAGGITVLWETDKVKQNSVFLRGAYGFSTNCEASVKVGIADRGAPQGFEDSYAFLAGVGAKGILYSTPSFSVGPILDFTWYSDYEDDISFSQGGTTWTGTEKIEGSWDLQVGIGLQAPVGKGIVFGGPSFFWNRADVTYRITNGSVNINVDNEYAQKTSFGGFAGVRYPVTDRIGVEVEGQYRSGFSAGATILYSF